MCRVHVQLLLRLRVHPAVDDPAAGKNQRVRAILVEHGELQVAVERRCGHGLPHFYKCVWQVRARLDLDQIKS